MFLSLVPRPSRGKHQAYYIEGERKKHKKERGIGKFCKGNSKREGKPKKGIGGGAAENKPKGWRQKGLNFLKAVWHFIFTRSEKAILGAL